MSRIARDDWGGMRAINQTRSKPLTQVLEQSAIIRALEHLQFFINKPPYDFFHKGDDIWFL
ncbi:hypothetical protein [Bacillus sp. Bos-x628]|uniref:hypothetical protein n=1 Tax=Bacillus maqinnsis TaxID=3229854 RepID=UPI00338DA752